MEYTYNQYSRLVEYYSRYRPRYPLQLLEWLTANCSLSPTQIVADIGAGTGKMAELFLKNGNPVYAVEPNQEMRLAAEHLSRAPFPCLPALQPLQKRRPLPTTELI